MYHFKNKNFKLVQVKAANSAQDYKNHQVLKEKKKKNFNTDSTIASVSQLFSTLFPPQGQAGLIGRGTALFSITKPWAGNLPG